MRARTVKVGTFSPSVLVEVAAETGALATAGLVVEEIPATSSPAQFAALLAGELDAVLTNPDNVVAYRCLPGNPLRRTADVRILAAVDGGLGLSLFGRPGHSAPGQLRRGVLGVDAPTTGFAFIAFELLERLGLRDVDYSVRSMGSTPRRTEALLSGQCDMTILNAGNDLRAEAAGAHRLSSVTTIGPYVGTVLAARGETIEQDRDMLAGLVGAIRTTCTELLAGNHTEIALSATQRRLGLHRAAASRYLDTLLDPAEGIVADGRMPQDALETAIRLRTRHSPSATALSSRDVLNSGIIDDGLLSAL
ncbi:ABC transporter substrate-binding protein [Kibdelosporangium persicum]|uniref:ABC-type nitrate/sulfonate/bicarbonate transport system substrate-binding protein n=1 Tax=Kibdelosporangium persicum TaxID=2698649 RepID=A0ABX2F5J5_9PSEU|nr:ABC transporter substrate-binding protein [Kibdelosporangium persicum]NRN66641.1 ABC-type nitrate/sulfonate/bicarbonate transport system substrate-binding protein [Kibdelosporangium persicum]